MEAILFALVIVALVGVFILGYYLGYKLGFKAGDKKRYQVPSHIVEKLKQTSGLRLPNHSYGNGMDFSTGSDVPYFLPHATGRESKPEA